MALWQDTCTAEFGLPGLRAFWKAAAHYHPSPGRASSRSGSSHPGRGDEMPTRMIRESILDSSRYFDCTESEQLLFIHLMLLADDFGCVSLAPAFISRRAFSERPGHARLMRMLQALADADLVRIYESEGARFGFIPRFGQRLRQMRLHNPLPPEALLEGDEDAKKKFSIFRYDNQIMSVNRPSTVGHLPAEGKRREEKRSGSEGQDPISPAIEHVRNALKGSEAKRAGINPEVQKPEQPDALTLKAQAAGITQREGEPRGQFALRVAQASAEATAPATASPPKSKFED